MARNYERDVHEIIHTPWDTSDAIGVPDTERVKLSGGAKRLEATFLYADLASSSRIAKELDRRVAARIMKSFLSCATWAVTERTGKVISFDGDRILGVFVGARRNTEAAKAALNIHYIVRRIIRAKFEAEYQSVRDASFRISHGVGIDSGEVLIVRGGVRGNNDLISIGRAPNLAAKLSDIRDGGYVSRITSSVYNRLADEAKYTNKNGSKVNMWERCTWDFLNQRMDIYRSSYHWRP